MYDGFSLMRDDKTLTYYRNEGNTLKTAHDPSTKPYYKCLSCPRFRHTCAGLPTRDMTLQEWCELIRDVMDVFHLSCSYVSEKGDVSIKTVERIKAGKIDQDILRGTLRRVEQVVLGHVGEHTCYLDHDDPDTIALINQLRAEVEYWKKENDRKAKIIDKYLDI